MKHFVNDDMMNMFRIRRFLVQDHKCKADMPPAISWQFLANNKLGATLDTTNVAKYDQVVQACLATGAYCMIDIHNFGRWNGGIIGQGGPTDEQFASLWTQLATKYGANPKVVFELMNEPHDLDINVWVQTCQTAVNAIRKAGAVSQMVLLPGANFDSAATLVSSGSAEALLAITNPDGTTNGLILDIHKYLDEDNSGTHSECVTDNTAAFATVADFLRQKGRLGIVSETGASNAASCVTAFCAQNAFINSNSDVFIGLVAWAAGSFSSSYLLSLTPNKQNGRLVDNALASQCVVRTWLDSSEAAASSLSVIATVVVTKSSSVAVSVGRTTVLSTGSSVMVATGTATIKMPTTLTTAGSSPTEHASTINSGDPTSKSFPVSTGSAGTIGTSPSQSVSKRRAVALDFVGYITCIFAVVIQTV